MNFLSAVWSDLSLIKTKIVLCGDPKQLGPVLKSKCAIELGFGVSLMELIMKKPCFQLNPSTSKYDPNYIVQLKKNYRSHPMILKSPNDMFYGGTLEALASESMCDLQQFYHSL